MKRALAAMLLACGWTTQAGLTFDFRALSAARFAEASGGTNLAAGLKPHPAHGFIYLPNWKGDPLPSAKEVQCHVDWREENGEYVLTTRQTLLDLCKGDVSIAERALSSWMFDVPHDGSGGRYRLSVRYKMGHLVGNFGGLLINYLTIREGFTKAAFENCDSEWKSFVRTIRVPAGVKRIPVAFELDGIGELRIRDFSLHRETPAATPVTVTQAAHGHVDKSFAVGEGQVGAISWFWKRREEETFDASRFSFRLTLPKGYSFKAANWGRKDDPRVAVRPDGTSEIRLPAKYPGPASTTSSINWTRFTVLLAADAGAAEGRGTFAALYDGKVVSNVETTRYFTIPPVKVAAKPRRYRNGFFAGSNTGVYDDRAAMRAFAEMASAAGADWFIDENPASPEVSEIYRAAGIAVQTPHVNGVRDGYHVDGNPQGLPEKGRPEEDRFVPRDPKAHRDFPGAICPLSVTEERPYFVTNTVPRLARILKGCDGLWTNWEPFGYVGQGCLCDRCRADFGRTIGRPDLPADEWWNGTRMGGSYYDQYRDYRGKMLGGVLKTLDRHLRRELGATFSHGLIPGVCWCEMGGYGAANDYPPEAKERHYAGEMAWMNPWGPYPCWMLDGAFAGAEGFNAIYHFVAKDVRAQVDRDYPAAKRPKLVAFPHGSQTDEWITEPEWIGLGLDAFFFNRWEASVVYFFPKGYDARYWRAFAEATDRAAKYEDFVWDGRRCDDEVTLRTPGFNKVFRGTFDKYLPGVRDVSLVQRVAYEKDGRMIVAVFNFADATDAAVEIAAAGFEPAAGSVPAARCRVFELRRK